MEKVNQKKNFLKGIIVENPVLVGLLGCCPTLATTTSIESAIGMAILFLFVLIGSNVLISLLRNIIPSEVKIPAYIVIIATFVTIVKMLCEAFLPELYSTLGVFIALIVVNCIILGRAEAYASKNGPLSSLVDALGMSVGFALALLLMAVIREFLGTGGFTFGKIFTFLPLVSWTPLSEYAIPMLVQSPGGFLTLACILAVIQYIKNHKAEKAVRAEKARIEELKKAKLAKMAEQNKANVSSNINPQVEVKEAK